MTSSLDGSMQKQHFFLSPKGEQGILSGQTLSVIVFSKMA
jgi:hypothetical protein